MIPILYLPEETVFASNGIGRLSDAVSCEVTEGRNGKYELLMEYPENGIHCDRIEIGAYIGAIHSDAKDIQVFRIYKITDAISGKIKIYARHLSYALSTIVVEPFTAGSAAEVMTLLPNKAINTCPFTFWTDKTVTGNFKVTEPKDIRSVLGGTSGSILDVYGKGEYEFDMYTVKLHLNRGRNTDVQIRYGVNLTKYEHTTDSGSTYNAAVPFWANEDADQVVTLPEWYLTPTGQTVTDLRLYPLDMSNNFDDAPTVAELRTAAQRRLDNSEVWRPDENFKVSFVELWETPEYEGVAAAQRLNLCDTCLVIYGGTMIREKVIEVTYDTLRERYSSMELGEPKTSFANMIIKEATAGISKNVVTKSYMQAAIDHATDLISGGTGGYLIIGTDANGKPNELLIMDTADKATAVNVWRFNSGGLGHSSTGYAGPYSDVALTMDGQINANMITAGILTANIIRAGIIADTQNKNSWNLDTGQLITTLGQIGGWNISDDGIYKQITVNGTSYRVKIKPPESYGDNFLQVQVLDNNLWYTATGLSMQYGLAVFDPSTHILLSMVNKDGIVIYQGTDPNYARTQLGKNAINFYDNGVLKTYITKQGLFVNGDDGNGNTSYYAFSEAGITAVYNGNMSFSVSDLALHFYNGNGNSVFAIIYTDYIQEVQTSLNIVPSGTSGAQSVGDSGRPWNQLYVNGIELAHQTGFIDWHFGRNMMVDYTARIIEESSGVLKAYNSIVSASDRRLKEDIEDIPDTDLALIDKLKPHKFRFKGSELESAGLVAQEVIESEKDLGIEDSVLVRGTGEEIPDPKHEGQTMTDYYAVDYNGLTTLLLAQVQEMKKKIDMLEAKIAALEGGK